MTQRVLGIDAGGTAVKFAAVEFAETPRVVQRAQWGDPQESSPDQAVAMMQRMGAEVVAAAGWDAAEAVGLGLAGLVDTQAGALKVAPNLAAWEGFSFRTALERVLGLPVRAANDASVFALAEWRWGAGSGAKNIVFLTLGTGIGGGLVSEGKLVMGDAGFAGEPGHVSLDTAGPECSCGNRGCAELYVGRRGVMATAQRIARERGEESSLPRNLTPRSLFDEAENGSELAQEIWSEVGTNLGDLLVTLTNLLNPERILLGGGLSGAGEWLLEPARRRLNQRSLVGRMSPPGLARGAWGSDGGVVGAAGLWFPEESDSRGER